MPGSDPINKDNDLALGSLAWGSRPRNRCPKRSAHGLRKGPQAGNRPASWPLCQQQSLEGSLNRD